MPVKVFKFLTVFLTVSVLAAVWQSQQAGLLASWEAWVAIGLVVGCCAVVLQSPLIVSERRRPSSRQSRPAQQMDPETQQLAAEIKQLKQQIRHAQSSMVTIHNFDNGTEYLIPTFQLRESAQFVERLQMAQTIKAKLQREAVPVKMIVPDEMSAIESLRPRLKTVHEALPEKLPFPHQLVNFN